MSESLVEEEVPPEKAFAALSDPTRIAILRTLWKAEDHTATFSELREIVEMNDSGQFNYHLSKLCGRFVGRTDNGYKLRLAGTRVVGALLSGAYTQIGSTISVAIDQPCPYCEGLLCFQYEDEQASINCDDCKQIQIRLSVPPGVFAGYDHEMLPYVTEQYLRNLVKQAGTGFCVTCEGRVHPRITLEAPPSDAKDLSRIPMVYYECERCGETTSYDLGTAFLDHSEVIAFYHNHNIDVRDTPLWRLITVGEDNFRILDEEPFRTNVIYTASNGQLLLTVDGNLDVLAIERE